VLKAVIGAYTESPHRLATSGFSQLKNLIHRFHPDSMLFEL
jgi:hypothetical protein